MTRRRQIFQRLHARFESQPGGASSSSEKDNRQIPLKLLLRLVVQATIRVVPVCSLHYPALENEAETKPQEHPPATLGRKYTGHRATAAPEIILYLQMYKVVFVVRVGQ
jgi:hypothetical protein